MSTSYLIEKAKSGRAKCKKCKEVLPKDELRIGTKSLDTRFGDGDKYTTSFTHIACFSLPRKVGKITVQEFVEDHLEDETPNLVLSDETKRQEIIDAIASKKGGRKSTGEGEGDDTAVSRKIAEIKAAMANEEEGEEKPSKKAKGDSKLKEEVDAMKIYGKMPNAELKDVLRWNLGYGMTGKKDELLLRCIDGHVNGRLARCPVCFKGHMQLNDSDAGETVKCGGYFDEDMNVRRNCVYSNKASAVARLQPWYHEQPTEEQAEEIQAITEEHKANAGGKPKASDIPPELVEAIKKLEWPDTSTMDGKKAAAKLMLEACATAVDIPEDTKKANMGIGKIIVNNPDASANDILELIVKEYGFKDKKQAASANQQGAIGASCKCPANAPVVQAFKELSELYLKEGNSNAGNSYNKAVIALMGLDFEVTVDNAKKLGSTAKTDGMKVDGIGKGSADKIHEFLATGTIEKLEEKRKLAA